MISAIFSLKPPSIITSNILVNNHRSRTFHPECPDRITGCIEILNTFGNKIHMKKPTGETNRTSYDFALTVIKSVHDVDHVEEVRENCAKKYPFLDPWDTDTYISPGTFDQCVIAQSAWIDGINDIISHGKEMAFAVTRPPGHHANKKKSMGFCIFNFAVGAADYAINHLKLKRVAMLDFDVVSFAVNLYLCRPIS
jgi:acetoin utilization deacetylase AcuC-like enzyme